MSIHATSIISERAQLGLNVSLGPYAIIEQETIIGDGTEIRAHSVIKRYTELGPENVVHEGAVLGGEPQDLGFSETESYLRIGARNSIRQGVTMHRGTRPGAVTGVGSK